MDLHQLRQFKKVAELEHITKASRILHVAQPALSKTIHNLEEEFGVPFFNRVGKRISLNENGKILLRCANDIFERLDMLERDLAVDNEKCRKEVVVSMPAASSHMPSLLAGFQALYPDIHLKIVQYYLNNTDIHWDICIMASRVPLKGNYEVLLQEEIVLAIPCGHHLFHRDMIELVEVADDPFISMRMDYSQGEIFSFYCEMAGFEPNVVLELDNQTTVWDMLELGVGIAMIPQFSWKLRENDRIHLAHIVNPPCTRYLGIQWREQALRSDAARAFRDYTIDFFRKFDA